MSKKLMLVKTTTSYAGDMDLSGIAIFTAEELKRHFKTAELLFKTTNDYPVEHGIGSNQSLYYDDFKEYKKQIKSTPISLAEAKKLMNHLKIKVNDGTAKSLAPHSSFGIFTLMDRSMMTDRILYEGGIKEATWLKDNGYTDAESYIEEYYP